MTKFKRAYIAKLLIQQHGFNIRQKAKGAAVYKNRSVFATGLNANEAIEAAIDRLDHSGQIDWNHLTINIY